MSDPLDAPGCHDTGGRAGIALAAGMQSTAVFGGPSNCYRYRFARTWGPGPAVLVVMMNPSMAEICIDDPTVAKVTRMARRWCCGMFGTLLIGNCFAYRAADQDFLAAVADPIGPDNDAHLLAMAGETDLVVIAYGAPKVKELRGRGPAVARMFLSAGIPLNVLRLDATGPWHPLYLQDATHPRMWFPG